MTDAGGEALGPPPANELPWLLETLLFVADEPQTAGSLARASGASEGAVKRALASLSDDYEARGLRLQEDGGKYQLVTAPGYAPWVEQFVGSGPSQRLSRAALETLTIVAYKQPCTRGEIEAIRGANSDKLVVSLEQRGLIEEAGWAHSPGRPRLYRTTTLFFEHFGLRCRADVPPLPAAEAQEQVEAAL